MLISMKEPHLKLKEHHKKTLTKMEFQHSKIEEYSVHSKEPSPDDSVNELINTPKLG